MVPFRSDKPSARFQPTLEPLEARDVPASFTGSHPLGLELFAHTSFTANGSAFLDAFGFTGLIPVGEGFRPVNFSSTAMPVLQEPAFRADGASIGIGLPIQGGQIGNGRELVQRPTSGIFSQLTDDPENRFQRATIAIAGTASEEQLTITFTGTQFDARTGKLLSAPIPEQTFVLQAVDDVDLAVKLSTESDEDLLGKGVVEQDPGQQIKTATLKPGESATFLVELSTVEPLGVSFRFGIQDLLRDAGWSITSRSRFLPTAPADSEVQPTGGIRTGNAVTPGAPRQVAITFTPSETAQPGSRAELTLPVLFDLGEGNRILDAVKLVAILEGGGAGEQGTEDTDIAPAEQSVGDAIDPVFERLSDLNSVADDNIAQDPAPPIDAIFERLQDLNGIGDNNLDPQGNPQPQNNTNLDSQNAIRHQQISQTGVAPQLTEDANEESEVLISTVSQNDTSDGVTPNLQAFDFSNGSIPTGTDASSTTVETTNQSLEEKEETVGDAGLELEHRFLRTSAQRKQEVREKPTRDQAEVKVPGTGEQKQKEQTADADSRNGNTEQGAPPASTGQSPGKHGVTSAPVQDRATVSIRR